MTAMTTTLSTITSTYFFQMVGKFNIGCASQRSVFKLMKKSLLHSLPNSPKIEKKKLCRNDKNESINVNERELISSKVQKEVKKQKKFNNMEEGKKKERIILRKKGWRRRRRKSEGDQNGGRGEERGGGGRKR